MPCNCEIGRINKMKELVHEKNNVGELIDITCGEHMWNMHFDKIKGEYLRAEFKKKKRDGSLSKVTSKKDLFTQYSHCPFCGIKYELAKAKIG